MQAKKQRENYKGLQSSSFCIEGVDSVIDPLVEAKILI